MRSEILGTSVDAHGAGAEEWPEGLQSGGGRGGGAWQKGKGLIVACYLDRVLSAKCFCWLSACLKRGNRGGHFVEMVKGIKYYHYKRLECSFIYLLVFKMFVKCQLYIGGAVAQW